MMKRVIAFDPGPHTGIAILDELPPIRPEMNEPPSYRLVRSYTIDDSLGTLNVYRGIREALERFGKDGTGALRAELPIVVCESFRTAHAGVGTSNAGLTTARLTGFIEGSALLLGYQLVWQNPSERKAYVADAKKLETNTVHEVSALAHAFAYYGKQALLLAPAAPRANSL